MTRLRALTSCAGIVALVPILAAAGAGPTRVRQDNGDRRLQTRAFEFGRSAQVYPIAAAHDYPGSLATPEIISKIGEILAAIDSPQDRTERAEQWLQYAKQVIARDQDFRDQWLELQRQQLAQDQEAAPLRLEVARLQMKIEELRAQNLRLEQENLQVQRQLSERGGGSAPRASLPGPLPQ